MGCSFRAAEYSMMASASSPPASDRYSRTIPASVWGFPAGRFTSQAFWDRFDRIRTGGDDELDQPQTRLLACHTTNVHACVASTSSRNQLERRGHNKQGRHNLRQAALNYVLDGDNGLGLCRHVCPGNVADAGELPAALANTIELQQAGVGQISAQPWNQAPAEVRARDAGQLRPRGGGPA